MTTKPPKFWYGVGWIAASIALLLVIRFGQSQSPTLEEFWVSTVLALIPAIGGIHEIMRYLRYRKHKKAATV